MLEKVAGGGKLAADTAGGQLAAKVSGSLDEDGGKSGHGIGHQGIDNHCALSRISGSSAVSISLEEGDDVSDGCFSSNDSRDSLNTTSAILTSGIHDLLVCALLAGSDLSADRVGFKENGVHGKAKVGPVESDCFVTFLGVFSSRAQVGDQQFSLLGNALIGHQVALHGGAEGKAVFTSDISLSGAKDGKQSNDNLHISVWMRK